jgi:hypothetical protein
MPRRGGDRSTPWVVIVPLILVGALVAVYTVSRVVQRPAELSMARESRPAPSDGGGNGLLVALAVIGAVAGVAGIVAACMRRPSPKIARRRSTETIPCPHCAERIRRDASVCFKCGFELDLFVDR